VGSEKARNGSTTNHVGADVPICPVERNSTGFYSQHKIAERCSAGQMRTSAPTWFVAILATLRGSIVLSRFGPCSVFPSARDTFLSL
jgi:hypothetical protein